METFTLNVADIRYDGKGISVERNSTLFVGTKDAPLTVFVDSDTDWAAVVPAAAGVVVALLVAWLTIGIQRTQIQGGISNFRHHWMTELRAAASELIVTLRLLANGCCRKDGYTETEAYWEYSKAVMQMHSKVSLLLSRDDSYSDALRKEGELLVQRVMATEFEDPEFKLLLGEIGAYQNALRAELEEAWEDAKSDLGFNRKFLLFRLFEKEKKKAERKPFKLSDVITWHDPDEINGQSPFS